MRLILNVYDALRTFDRPATRRELEKESGLLPEQVRKGLDGLRRHHLLVVYGPPRFRCTYELVAKAPRPIEIRGRKAKDAIPEEAEE